MKNASGILSHFVAFVLMVVILLIAWVYAHNVDVPAKEILVGLRLLLVFLIGACLVFSGICVLNERLIKTDLDSDFSAEEFSGASGQTRTRSDMEKDLKKMRWTKETALLIAVVLIIVLIVSHLIW